MNPNNNDPRWQMATTSTNERLEIIHREGVFHDVIFKVEERGKARKNYPAHMLILACASPVFERQFYLGDPPPIQDRLPFTVTESSFTQRAFETMLLYAYSPQGEVSFSSPVHAMETYHVARKYAMERLKELCGDFLKTIAFSPEDIVPIYEDELHVEIEGIHQKCFRVVEKKPMLVMRIAAAIASGKTIAEFLQRERLVIPSELALLQRIIDGAQFRSYDKSDEIGDATRFLKKSVFPFIRFLTMSTEQFAVAFAMCKPIITKEEGFEIFYKLCQRQFTNDQDDFPEWCSQITKYRTVEGARSIEITPTSLRPVSPRANSLTSGLEIKANEGNAIFTGLWFKYGSSTSRGRRLTRSKLNISHPTQLLNYDQVTDFRMDDPSSEGYLQFLIPLPVLSGETAEIILTLDNVMDLAFYEFRAEDSLINVEGFVINIQSINQPPDDKLFAVSKLEYEV